MSNLIDNTSPFLNDLDYSNLSAFEKDKIDALIDVASVLIEKELNRKFLADDYTDEIHSGDNLNSIFVRNIPLNSLSSINLVVNRQVTELSYDDSVFDINSRTGEIKWKSRNRLSSEVTDYYGYFPEGRQNIKINYNGGFAEVPSPIQFLCAEMVKAAYSPTEVVGAIESEKLGQYFVKTKKGILEHTMITNTRITSLYKIRRV